MEAEDVTQETHSGYVNPLTGEVVDALDVEAMIAALSVVKQQIDDLKNYKVLLESRVSHETPGAAPTEHVLRGRWKATVKHPQPGWDKPKLKRIWAAYADNPHRETLLRIEGVAVNMRDFNVALKTSGDEGFTHMVDAIKDARTEPSGMPRVEVKKL